VAKETGKSVEDIVAKTEKEKAKARAQAEKRTKTRPNSKTNPPLKKTKPVIPSG
jgi:hypothetical protein